MSKRDWSDRSIGIMGLILRLMFMLSRARLELNLTD